jgi:hypothetical protein
VAAPSESLAPPQSHPVLEGLCSPAALRIAHTQSFRYEQRNSASLAPFAVVTNIFPVSIVFVPIQGPAVADIFADAASEPLILLFQFSSLVISLIALAVIYARIFLFMRFWGEVTWTFTRSAGGLLIEKRVDFQNRAPPRTAEVFVPVIAGSTELQKLHVHVRYTVRNSLRLRPQSANRSRR